MYQPNCGLDQVQMSFGHDEYLYQVLQHNQTKLPDEALYCVRYHSFYPWHDDGDYDYLCTDQDREMMKWVKEFKWVLSNDRQEGKETEILQLSIVEKQQDHRDQ